MVASTCVTPCWNPKQFLHLITLIKWGIVRVKPSCGQLGPRMTTGSSGRRAASWGFSQIWEFGNLSLRWRYPRRGACTWASANIIAGPLKDRVIQWDAILGTLVPVGHLPDCRNLGLGPNSCILSLRMACAQEEFLSPATWASVGITTGSQ